MLRENRWKVLLVVVVGAIAAEPSRAVSLVYQKPYKQIMFVPKNLYRRNRKQRVLFLDEDENHQPFGRGEIDLTVDKSYDSKIKFDDNQDYEFTSPEDQKTIGETPSGNERFYEPLPRFRPAFHAYPAYYQGRFGRPYAPGFGFDPYIPQVPFAPSRNSFYGQNSGWKARSPRVVFPYASDSVNSLVQTNSHAGPGGPGGSGGLGGPGGIDNVVFREQNFGINDIGTDEQSLQDIGSGNGDAFAERDANDHHRARDKTGNRKAYLQKPMFIQTEGIKNLKRIDYYFPNVTSTVLPKFKPISDEQMLRMSQILKDMPRITRPTLMPSTRKGRLIEVPSVPTASNEAVSETDKKDRQEGCPQGGSCEFFFYCWMVGGLLEGSCGGLLKGCCHRVAKAGILGVQDSNSIEYSANEGLSYGPVINDESK